MVRWKLNRSRRSKNNKLNHCMINSYKCWRRRFRRKKRRNYYWLKRLMSREKLLLKLLLLSRSRWGSSLRKKCNKKWRGWILNIRKRISSWGKRLRRSKLIITIFRLIFIATSRLEKFSNNKLSIWKEIWESTAGSSLLIHSLMAMIKLVVRSCNLMAILN